MLQYNKSHCIMGSECIKEIQYYNNKLFEITPTINIHSFEFKSDTISSQIDILVENIPDKIEELSNNNGYIIEHDDQRLRVMSQYNGFGNEDRIGYMTETLNKPITIDGIDYNYIVHLRFTNLVNTIKIDYASLITRPKLHIQMYYTKYNTQMQKSTLSNIGEIYNPVGQIKSSLLSKQHTDINTLDNVTIDMKPGIKYINKGKDVTYKLPEPLKSSKQISLQTYYNCTLLSDKEFGHIAIGYTQTEHGRKSTLSDWYGTEFEIGVEQNVSLHISHNDTGVIWEFTRFKFNDDTR